MRNLIQILIKYHAFFLFLFLEVVSLVLISQFNRYQSSKMANLTVKYAGGIYNTSASVTQYLSLKNANEKLAEENARLKNFLMESRRDNLYTQYIFNDSIILKDFRYSSARVINNSTHKQMNYITLNKGTNDGIEAGMAVTCSQGVVGIVKGVSRNYAVVLPIHNLRTRISSKVDSTGYFGTLVWDGKDYRRAKLQGIEQNAHIEIGQKIVTTGFGAVFPEGVLVGTIDEFKRDDEGIFYEIDVLLSTNFKKLYNVEVVSNLSGNEIKELEQEEANE